MVVVNKIQTPPTDYAAASGSVTNDSSSLCHVDKLHRFIIAQQMNPVRCANCEIREAVVVVVAHRASRSLLRRTNTELLCSILKLSFSQVVEES